MHSSSPDPALEPLRRAQRGDLEGLSWLIEHFSGPLLASARKRLAAQPQLPYEAEDLVQEVWQVFLERVAQLEPREASCTPLIMSFLSRTLAYRFLSMARNRKREGTSARPSAAGADSELAAQTSGIVTKVSRLEQTELLLQAIDSLPSTDREVIQLRAFDQLSPEEAGRILRISKNAVSARYVRALKRLRSQFPSGVFTTLLHLESESSND